MLATLKQQFVEILSDIGFIKRGIKIKDVQLSATQGSDGVVNVTGEAVNVNNENLELLSALLVASLYPNIIQPGFLDFITLHCGEVEIHPSSVNADDYFPSNTFLVYHELVRTSKPFVRESSVVSDLSLLMFAGGNIEVKKEEGYEILSIDHMVQFKTKLSQVATSLEAIKSELNKLLADKISEPDMNLILSPRCNALISCIVKLFPNSLQCIGLRAFLSDESS